MKKNKLVIIFVFILLSVVGPNAFAANSDVHLNTVKNPAVVPVKNKESGAAAGLRKVNTGIIYPYVLRRNPFQTFLYSGKPSLSYKVGEIPLLQYQLSSLKVVGIMDRRGKRFAMISTPDGRSYIVTVGSIVGADRASIVSIGSDYISLTENSYNVLGQVQTRPVIMKMH